MKRKRQVWWTVLRPSLEDREGRVQPPSRKELKSLWTNVKSKIEACKIKNFHKTCDVCACFTNVGPMNPPFLFYPGLSAASGIRRLCRAGPANTHTTEIALGPRTPCKGTVPWGVFHVGSIHHYWGMNV